jgi:hypothetical protein
LSLELVESLIDSDSADPAEEPMLRLEAMEIVVGFEKSGLSGVHRVFPIAGDSHDHAVDPGFIAREELVEGGVIAAKAGFDKGVVSGI